MGRHRSLSDGDEHGIVRNRFVRMAAKDDDESDEFPTRPHEYGDRCGRDGHD